MVLAVCRQLLRHPHDADDAFQATFLVLVRKARSIRVGESLAPWLSSVAYRTARRVRDRRTIPTPRHRADRGARSIFPGRGLSLRPPAPAARGAGSPPGQAPGSHRALPPRGQVARGGGASAALAGRHAEQPPLPRSTAPGSRLERRGLEVSSAMLSSNWLAGTPAAVAPRLIESTVVAAIGSATRPDRACPGPVLNSRSPENHVPQKAQNDLAGRPRYRCDRKLRRVGPLACDRVEDLHSEPWGGTCSPRREVERPPESPDRQSHHRVR